MRSLCVEHEPRQRYLDHVPVCEITVLSHFDIQCCNSISCSLLGEIRWRQRPINERPFLNENRDLISNILIYISTAPVSICVVSKKTVEELCLCRCLSFQRISKSIENTHTRISLSVRENSRILETNAGTVMEYVSAVLRYRHTQRFE